MVSATAILFEEIAYVKDDASALTAVLGFSKGYLCQRVPLLFGDESAYKSFMRVLAAKYASVVIVVTADELKVSQGKSIPR